MTRLIIARHGNTFDPDDTPTRVGKHTDLPLVEKGRLQARALGHYLKEHALIPDVIYSSTLIRTKETATLALEEAGISLPVHALDIFDEIDYGPDENKPESEVIARLGEDAIKAWDTDSIVPDGWLLDPDIVIRQWQQFADEISRPDTSSDQTILVVTSNGVARFAGHITENYDQFKADYPIKLKTGALGILRFSGDTWTVQGWNVVPLLNFFK